MNNFAEQIRSAVDMPSVLAYYGLSDGTTQRIPCPIHDGKDKNFAVFHNGFRCFVCGAHGSVIDFVMQYFNLPFVDALKKINDDFRLGLPIGVCLSEEEQAEADRKSRRMREAMNARKREREAVQNRYQRALDRYITLDILKAENAPTGIKDGISAEYALACREIDRAAYELEEAENALYEYKHKQS